MLTALPLFLVMAVQAIQLFQRESVMIRRHYVAYLRKTGVSESEIAAKMQPAVLKADRMNFPGLRYSISDHVSFVYFQSGVMHLLKVFRLVFFLAVGSFLTFWLVLRWSRRKSGVRLAHIVRCLAYSYDCVFPLALVAFTIATHGGFRTVSAAMMGLALGTLVMASYRLTTACRRYLRFDHPEGIAIAVQLIACLFALNAELYIEFAGV